MKRKEREIRTEVGGPVDEARVTLGVHGPELDPAGVSELLGCAPTTSHRAGDPRGPSMPRWRQGAWLLQVEGGSAPGGPEELLRQLLSRLPSDPATWERLRAKGTIRVTFGLFVSAWNRGFELSPAAVALLSATGAQVGFDIYADTGRTPP